MSQNSTHFFTGWPSYTNWWKKFARDTWARTLNNRRVCPRTKAKESGTRTPVFWIFLRIWKRQSPFEIAYPRTVDRLLDTIVNFFLSIFIRIMPSFCTIWSTFVLFVFLKLFCRYALFSSFVFFLFCFVFLIFEYHVIFTFY